MTTRVQIQIKDGSSIIWKKSLTIEYEDVNGLIEVLNKYVNKTL